MSCLERSEKKKIKHEQGKQVSDLRFSTIAIGLKSVLKDVYASLQQEFINASVPLGVHMHISSIVANWVLNHYDTISNIDKTFYDNIMSALDGGALT